MTLNEFKDGIEIIKGVLNWTTIDIDNGIVMSMWYERCKAVPKEQFLELVKWYCQHKDFPPRSPNELATSPIMIYRQQFPTRETMKASIIDWLRRYEFNYERCMKHCPTMVEAIPISRFAFERFRGEYGNKEIDMFLDQWEKLVDDEVKQRATQFLKGKLKLPFTKAGKLIPYEEEGDRLIIETPQNAQKALAKPKEDEKRVPLSNDEFEAFNREILDS